eukprot:9193688-Pyramimonas_sp.AAC.1
MAEGARPPHHPFPAGTLHDMRQQQRALDRAALVRRLQPPVFPSDPSIAHSTTPPLDPLDPLS